MPPGPPPGPPRPVTSDGSAVGSIELPGASTGVNDHAAGAIRSAASPMAAACVAIRIKPQRAANRGPAASSKAPAPAPIRMTGMSHRPQSGDRETTKACQPAVRTIVAGRRRLRHPPARDSRSKASVPIPAIAATAGPMM